MPPTVHRVQLETKGGGNERERKKKGNETMPLHQFYRFHILSYFSPEQNILNESSLQNVCA